MKICPGTQGTPALSHLIQGDDIPRRERKLPRALTPEQDELIQNELKRRDDLASNLFLLQRHTGMRLGECLDLSLDCLRSPAPGVFAVLVPLGKLKTERLVPVDSFVCKVIDRLRELRPDTATDNFLIGRPRARETMIRTFRACFRQVTTAAGIKTRITPHQLRHTYATEMLMAGVSFAAIMKLLGHRSPHMTLAYLTINQLDLQREYHKALAHPRHSAPPTRSLPSADSGAVGLPALVHSLRSAQHVLEMLRRAAADNGTRRLLERLGNRLIKIIAELVELHHAE